MGIDAFKRSEIMGLKHQSTEESKAAIQDFLAIAAKDDRRLLWIVEKAADDVAVKISQHEQEIVVAERFGHFERAKRLSEYVARYEEDFKFLYSVLQIIKERNMEKWAEGLASYFRDQKKGKSVKKID